MSWWVSIFWRTFGVISIIRDVDLVTNRHTQYPSSAVLERISVLFGGRTYWQFYYLRCNAIVTLRSASFWIYGVTRLLTRYNSVHNCNICASASTNQLLLTLPPPLFATPQHPHCPSPVNSILVKFSNVSWQRSSHIRHPPRTQRSRLEAHFII